jgi:hypothetical protein
VLGVILHHAVSERAVAGDGFDSRSDPDKTLGLSKAKAILIGIQAKHPFASVEQYLTGVFYLS